MSIEKKITRKFVKQTPETNHDFVMLTSCWKC